MIREIYKNLIILCCIKMAETLTTKKEGKMKIINDLTNEEKNILINYRAVD